MHCLKTRLEILAEIWLDWVYPVIKTIVIPWLHEVVHNVLIHPLLPFLPTAWGDYIHDTHAKWAYGWSPYEDITDSETEEHY